MKFILLARFQSSDQSLTKGMLPRVNLKLGEKTRKRKGKKLYYGQWTTQSSEERWWTEKAEWKNNKIKAAKRLNRMKIWSFGDETNKRSDEKNGQQYYFDNVVIQNI